MRGRAVVVAVAAVAITRTASATPLVVDRATWGPDDEATCVAENDDRSPAILREREARVPQEPVLHVDAAVGAFMGIGSPGGIGGSIGAIKSSGTPVGAGYATFLSADLRLLRPVWVNVQAHGFASPAVNAGSVMGDLLIGYDFYSRYGNQFVKAHVRRSNPPRYQYSCVLARSDIAFVGGTKQVYARGDPRVPIFTALSTGLEMRLLRDLFGTAFGMDVTLLTLYDPALGTFGAQFQEAIHIGSFVVLASAGGLWKRGGWATFGVGSTFGI